MRSAAEATTNFPYPWPGGEWHPRNIMDMELIAARGILSLAAKYRSNYLRNFYELGKTNLKPVADGEPIAYLIPAGQGRDENVAKMIGALVEQGVEVHRLDKEIMAQLGKQSVVALDANSGRTGSKPNAIALWKEPSAHEVPAGSYIIFLNQPYHDNVLALFEPQIYPDRTTATGEAERPYDVAGWTLPMTMGLECPAVLQIVDPPAARKLTLIKSENDVRRDFALPLANGDKSPIANPIKPGTRIAIYKNSRAGNMDEGWTRYVFDTFNVPYQSVSENALAEGNPRAKFDVVVLPSEQTRAAPDGEAPETPRGLNDAAWKNLSRFVEEGGNLICFDGSCGQLIRQFKLPLRNVLEGVRSSEFYCPGSVLRIEVDTANPIARTMSKDTDAYFINSSAFDVTDGGKVQVIARYAKQDVLRSGWLRGEDKIKDKVALAEVAMGKGRIVLFGFRPQHRGQTWGTFPFIWNAVNLGGG